MSDCIVSIAHLLLVFKGKGAPSPFPELRNLVEFLDFPNDPVEIVFTYLRGEVFIDLL